MAVTGNSAATFIEHTVTVCAYSMFGSKRNMAEAHNSQSMASPRSTGTLDIQTTFMAQGHWTYKTNRSKPRRTWQEWP